MQAPKRGERGSPLTNSAFLQLCGLAGLIAGIALLAGTALTYSPEDTPLSEASMEATWIPFNALYLATVVLILLFLPGIYLVQRGRTKAVGLAVHTYATVAISLMVGLMCIVVFVPPSIAPVAPEFLDAEDPSGPLGTFFAIAWSLGSIAFILIGLTTLWARTPARWAGALLVLGTLVNFAPEPAYLAGDALTAAGFGWLGLALFQHGRRAATETDGPHPVETGA